MTELTDQQRAERGHHARRALEEFLDPAFEVAKAEYQARLSAVCASKPWATNEIAALANATRVVAEVRGQIMGLVMDGAEAQKQIDRAKRIETLTPAKRRLLNIGAI